MARRGRSLYGRAWFNCHCGRRFRSTNVPDGEVVWCPSCGLAVGTDNKEVPGAWGGLRGDNRAARMWDRLRRDTLAAPLDQVEGDAPFVETAVGVSTFIVAAPPEPVVGVYEELVVEGVAKMEACFPHWAQTTAWMVWHAGWSIDGEGNLFHRVTGTTLKRENKPKTE